MLRVKLRYSAYFNKSSFKSLLKRRFNKKFRLYKSARLNKNKLKLILANKSKFRRRKLLRLYRKKLKQMLNNKFRWRKSWLRKKKVKIIRVYSFRELMRKGAILLRQVCNYSTTTTRAIKTPSLYNIIVSLRKNVPMRSNFKKPTAHGLKSTKLQQLSSGSKEENMIYLFCKRIVANNRSDVPKKVLVDLYAQTYISLYKKKKKPVVSQSSKAERIPIACKMTEKPVVKPPAPKITEKPVVKPPAPRKHSKNWIDPEIWKTMSGKARREFLIKTGKHVERKPTNVE